MPGETKNIFISHVHEDDDTLKSLRDLLTKNGYIIRDGSIDRSKPNQATSSDYIKSEILAPRIRWAGTFLVLISPHTHTSEWVPRTSRGSVSSEFGPKDARIQTFLRI